MGYELGSGTKKVLVLFMSAVLVGTVAGCVGDEEDDDDGGSSGGGYYGSFGKSSKSSGISKGSKSKGGIGSFFRSSSS